MIESKHIARGLALVLGILALVCNTGLAAPGVIFVGSIQNDSSSEISEWSDSAVTKSLDIDNDDLYGTDGYSWVNTSDSGNPVAVLASLDESAPSYAAGIAHTGAGGGVSGSYSGADDRRNAADTADVNVGYAGPNYNGTTGATVLQELFAYTMSSDMLNGETIRVGVVLDSLNDTVVGADSLRVVAGGASADATGVARSGVIDMYFFDISGLTSGQEIQIWGAKSVDNSNYGYNAITIGGVLFDSSAATGSELTLTSPSAGSITTDSATLSATLANTNADVTVSWDSDDVTDPSTHTGWEGSVTTNGASVGTIALAATGLSSDTVYEYAFFATNTTLGTSVWSTVEFFTTETPVAWVVGVDFGGTVTPVNSFNEAQGSSGTIPIGNVIDTNNAVVTGVSLSWSGGLYPNNDSAGAADLPGQPSFFDDSNLTDWIVENASGYDIEVTFSGLDDSFTYELVIGSAFIVNATDTDTEWTADGQSGTSVHDSGPAAYVTLANLSTDGSGNLVITSEPAGAANFTALSALRLTAYGTLSNDPTLDDLAASSITTNAATLSATLGGTNADVTVFWDSDDVTGPSTHTGWEGSVTTNGASTGTVALAAASLSPDTLYAYAFVATNATLGTSVWSAVDTFATELSDAQAPTFTNAAGLTGATIGLGWQNNASNLTGFILRRATNGAGPYTNIATLAAGDTSYTDSGLNESTTYHYQLAATNGSNGSATAFGLAQTNATTTGATPIGIGTVIGVDFGPTAPSNNFNNAATGSGSIAGGSMIDTAGAALIGVGFSWNGGGVDDASLTESELTGQPAVFDDSNLTDWLIRVDGASTGLITLTFANLDDSLRYDLLIGSGYSDDDANCTWSADGQSGTIDSDDGPGAFVSLTNLCTDGSGNLVITSAGVSPAAHVSVVSALTLTVKEIAATAIDALPASGIATHTATLSAMLQGNDADVTVYWEAGAVADPATHTGWDGTNGPAAEIWGTPFGRSASGLSVDTFYSYAFFATNASLGTGVWSSVGTFYTALGDAQAPTFTNAVAVSSSAIALGWESNTSNHTGFVLQRSSTGIGGLYTTIATPTAGAVSYTDSGLLSTSTYHYQLAATNGNNGSITAFPLARTNATTSGNVTLALGMAIGIDLGPTTSANWNNFGADGTIGAGSVVDLTGTPIDDVSVTVSGAGYGTDGSDGWAEAPAGSLPDVPDSATTDIGIGGASGISITISNLSPSARFDLAAVTVAGAALDRQDTITVTGSVVYPSSTILRADAHNNGQYHSLTHMIPTAGGVLTIVVTDVSGNDNPICNMVRLEVVPPPGTLFKFR
jgi:hypothetical protein